MSKNRYGRIYHSNHNHINLRFPSVDARREFTEKFEKYHASHDHDGEAPRFEDITAQEAGSTNYESGKLHDAHSVTIDGYATYEIEEYHEDEKHTRYYRYKPPTCCVPPLISIERKLVDSSTLERHELSAIFGDMSDDEYQSLLASVEKDGFIDNVVRLYEGQILDGYHRYRAAKELNLLRKLRFTQWHEAEHRDGDPRVFVYAKNMERRHQEKSVRAQITVVFNERFGMGRPKSEESSPNGGLKSREDLAKEAGVSTRTIDRAIAVEKEGESEAIIAGEKSAGDVIKARDANKAKKLKKQVLKNMWDTRIQAARDYTGDGDTDLNLHLTLPELEKGFVENNKSYALAFRSGMLRIDKARGFQDFQDRAFEVDEYGNAKVDISTLQEEYKAIMTYSGDIRQWQRPDWSPDTNWILPLIEAKKKAKGTPKAEPNPEPDIKELREQVKAQMTKYKQWYKDTDYQESDLVSRASFSQFIHVLRESRETPQEGAATVEELKDLLDTLKRKSYPFAHKLRQIVRPGQAEPDEQETASDTDKAEALDKFRRQKRDLYAQIHETPLVEMKDEFGNANSDKAIHSVMRAAYKAYDLDDALLWSEKEIEGWSAKKIDGLTSRYFLMAQDLANTPRADWVAELYQEVSDTEEAVSERSLSERMDRCRADLIDVYQQTYDWDGLEIQLYTEEYGLGADVIAIMQKEIAAEHPKPTSPTAAGCEVIDASDEDTSFAEIDNLPAVKYFLESLLKQVGEVEHQADRDNFTVAIFDTFTTQFEGVSEREQLSLLIDVAYTLVAESM